MNFRNEIGMRAKSVVAAPLLSVALLPLAACGDSGQRIDNEPLATQSSALTGSWTALANAPPAILDTCLVLTNGDVMCHQSGSNAWHRLTPDIFGSYQNGTWDTTGPYTPAIAPMPNGTDVHSGSNQFGSYSFNCNPCQYGPTYFASAVLADGNVVIFGGEYNNPGVANGGSVWTNIGFIYNPVANTWSAQLKDTFGGGNVGDVSAVVQQDGTFIAGNSINQGMESLNEGTGVFTAISDTGMKSPKTNEAGWYNLYDGTILTVDAVISSTYEIYNPSTKAWTSGSTPVNMTDFGAGTGGTQEIGPCVHRPDNTVMCFSGSPLGKNALYNPSTKAWSHTTSMDFPVSSGTSHYSMADGPGAALPNGNILVMASPVTTSQAFNTPSHFYEVGLSNNTLTQVSDSPNAASFASYQGRLLVLPTGQVLLTASAAVGNNTVQDVVLYSNGGTANASWAPAITSFPNTITAQQTYTISGTGFNGFSLGGTYGDDSQSSTNYPLVRLTNVATGHVRYARTFGHSRMGVEATGSSNTVTTSFQVPATFESGPATIQVVANGIASAPVNTNACGFMGVVQQLNKGQSVTSCNGQYTLTMQNDGNVVQYKGSQAVWAVGPGFGGAGGTYFIMQPDGNLVEMANTEPIWATGGSTPGSYLRVQDDGNLVVYSPSGTALWASIGGLSAGAELINGGYTRSADGRFQLSMQADGNLVLYFGSQALWASHTDAVESGDPGARAIMQPDGNFVVYGSVGEAEWASGTVNHPGAHVSVQNDGNMVVYSPSGTALWATNTCCH